MAMTLQQPTFFALALLALVIYLSLFSQHVSGFGHGYAGGFSKKIHRSSSLRLRAAPSPHITPSISRATETYPYTSFSEEAETVSAVVPVDIIFDNTTASKSLKDATASRDNCIKNQHSNAIVYLVGTLFTLIAVLGAASPALAEQSDSSRMCSLDDGDTAFML